MVASLEVGCPLLNRLALGVLHALAGWLVGRANDSHWVALVSPTHRRDVVDKAKCPEELLLKEALHIHITPVEEGLNRDTGLEILRCWMAALRKQ